MHSTYLHNLEIVFAVDTPHRALSKIVIEAQCFAFGENQRTLNWHSRLFDITYE